MGWIKDIVSWKLAGTLYLSVPFTWLLPKAKEMVSAYKGHTVAGGPAVSLMGNIGADVEGGATPFDVLAMHNPLATFTTRGCVRQCPFCAVPIIEGNFRELKTWKPAPLVCDNNLLAASKNHFVRVIESLLNFDYVDFNQGLDARLFTSWHADQLRKLKGVKVRFAMDHVNMEGQVKDAVDIGRRAGLKNYGVYVLIGFKDDPEDAFYRLEKVREWGIWPNPMRYQPLDAMEKNAFVADGWTAHELKRMMRYYSRLGYLGHIPYKDYMYMRDEYHDKKIEKFKSMKKEDQWALRVKEFARRNKKR